MNGSPAAILVADDGALNRILFTTTLEELGYEAETAENGVEALEKLRERPYDVLLLDLLMPELDGFGVLSAMKEDSAFDNTDVIIVSAMDDLESVIRCLEAGASDYLPKPFDPVLLRVRLNASLLRKRLRACEEENARLRERLKERGEP